ncbi:MAG: hypothetical protein JWM88_2680 [Verrucomicrobia bacterium]|nr:hypothetical protein [Verrucomicrobiota bacterium]
MKFGRGVFAGLVVLALLLLAVAAVFTDAVQTWAVRRVLARYPGAAVSVGRVSAGWSHVTLRDLRAVQSGAVLVVPSAEADLPLWSAAVSKKLTLHRLVAHGWSLDLSHVARKMAAGSPPPGPAARELSLVTTASAAGEATAASAPRPAFAGIFSQLKFPFDLAVDGVDLRGDVILPAVPGHPVARAKVTLTGGGLAAGKAGKFDYAAVVSFSGGDVAVSTVTLQGTLGIVMDTPRTIARLVAANAATAEGPKFPAGVKLAVDLSAARSAGGESYAASISSGAKQLAALETTYPAGASRLGGNWRLDMRDSDVAPFSFGREVPAFEAVGEGRFDTDTAFAEVRASGKLDTMLDRLGVVDARLASLGAVHLSAEFDLAQRDEATRIDQLTVTIESGRPVAKVEALQPFEFNLRTGELNVADPGKDLLGVVLQGVPLAWIAPVFAQQGVAIAGGDVRGEFFAGARNGGFALRSKAPLTVDHLSVSRGEHGAVLSAVDLSLTASGDYTPQGWQLEIAPFTVRSGDSTLLSLEAKMGQLAGVRQPVKMTGKWTGQLPAIFRQPFAAGSARLDQGDAEGNFAASIAEKQGVELRLAVKNLAAAGAPALPSVTFDLRADREPDGKISFNAPLVLERDGRKSDLLCSGTVVKAVAGLVVDARLSSEFLAVEDAQLLAGLVGGGAAPAQPSAPVAAADPFWAGVTGQVALGLKKVVYNSQFQVTDIAGTLRIEAGGLKLVNGRGGFDAESDVKLAGGVTFRRDAPKPYELAADFALNNFATAPAFQAINPTKPATLDARINLTSKLAGAGETLADLAARTRGDLLITSKGGLFRGLSADLTDRIQTTQSRVTAIASFLGVVTDDFVNKTRILSDIAKALSEIPFDQLSLTAVRDASLNVQLKDFTLISPEVRINGDGEIRYAEGVPVLAQPMNLQLKLGARGKLGDLIKRAGLLESREDNLGYSAFAVPLKISGTAGNPDTGEIRNALLNSALQRSGLLDGLLGK